MEGDRRDWVQAIFGWSLLALLFIGAMNCAERSEELEDQANKEKAESRWQTLRDLGMSKDDADHVISTLGHLNAYTSEDEDWEEALIRTATEGPAWPSEDLLSEEAPK
jgi:hypothetical protein